MNAAIIEDTDDRRLSSRARKHFVKEIMSTQVEYISPTETVQVAAKKMQKDLGFLPVIDDGVVVGAITDRDIVVKAISFGKDPKTAVLEIMSSPIQYCFEDDTIYAAAKKMQKFKIRRLVVLDSTNHFVGIISVGDIAWQYHDMGLTHELIEKVSEPY